MSARDEESLSSMIESLRQSMLETVALLIEANALVARLKLENAALQERLDRLRPTQRRGAA